MSMALHAVPEYSSINSCAGDIHHSELFDNRIMERPILPFIRFAEKHPHHLGWRLYSSMRRFCFRRPVLPTALTTVVSWTSIRPSVTISYSVREDVVNAVGHIDKFNANGRFRDFGGIGPAYALVTAEAYMRNRCVRSGDALVVQVVKNCGPKRLQMVTSIAVHVDRHFLCRTFVQHRFPSRAWRQFLSAPFIDSIAAIFSSSFGATTG